MKRQDSVFSKENSDIWGWVYGVPTIVGILFILVGLARGNDAGIGFGGFLIVSVIGSFLVISFCEWLNNLGATRRE